CTRKLLDTGTYTYLKQVTGEKRNFLGSAIALISQANESKIMAAKTVFTERSCKVATDLFDGHLREIGALDLDECSKFVEAETGFKVQFVSKPGSNTWVDDKNEKSSSPPLSLQAAIPAARQFFPPHSSTFFSASTSPVLPSPPFSSAATASTP